jgi:2-polyprenyl-6-hydroxyphenyl methylase/3-demethylubiquinone-9 3-methyltransferase
MRNDLTIHDRVADRWWSDDIRWVRTLRDLVPGRRAWFDRHIDWPGKDVLDLGCAGGFLAEAMAARGATVTGIDPAARAIAATRARAGCSLFDIINRTPIARLATVTIAEEVLRLLPRGTHDLRPSSARGNCARGCRARGRRRGSGGGTGCRSWSRWPISRDRGIRSNPLCRRDRRMTDLPRENAQSYPRPPRLEPVPQRIRIILGGAVVADTGSALRVLETHHAPAHYLPAADVPAALRPVAGTSFCEWKGVAR